jgi:hypothetical protein
VHVTVELAVWRLRPEWKQEIGEAPVRSARAGFTVSCIRRAPGSVGDVILRGTNPDLVAQWLFLSEIIRIDVTSAV